MPIALVRAFVAMLPRLQAEEQLAAIEAATIGNCVGEPQDRQRRVRELEREALGGRRRRPAKASNADLAAMGIGMTLVDAQGQEIGNG